MAAVVLLPAIALLPSPAGAVVLTVDTPTDVVAADGLTSLREAVATANSNGIDDEIVLDGGTTYLLTDCGLGQLLHDEAADLLISGNGATIEQSCIDARILEKSGNNDAVMELNDLTLATAPNSGVNLAGHAVAATSQLILDTVTIAGADAGANGSAVEIDFGSSPHDLVLRNSTITGSTGNATSNVNPSGVMVESSILSDNSGNGISIGDGSPIDVLDSDITNNGGSGIITSGQGFGLQPEVTITNTTIADNGDAGFFCLSSCRILTVTNSIITGNGAAASTGRGGGLSFPVVLAGGTLPSVTITDSTISDNIANHPGGALWVAGSFASSGSDQPSISISDSMFANNQTTCADCGGGALSVRVGDLSISGTTFENNEATGDGGAVAYGRAEDTEIVEPADLEIISSNFVSNSSDGDGGAIAVQADSATIGESTLSGNDAGGDGGAVLAGGVFGGGLTVSGDLTITQSTLASNSAASGGALRLSFPNGSAASLENSTVDSNTATVAGGGLAAGSTELLTLDYVTLTSNEAPVGSNLASSGPVSLGHSIVAEPGPGTNCAAFPGAPILVVPDIVSAGFNWLSDVTCSAGVADVVAPGESPALGLLADNGGSTQTRAPLLASPVAGLVPPANCDIAIDQRSFPRPAGLACEPGAVEIAEDPPAPPEGFPASVTSEGDLILGGTKHSEAFLVEVAGAYITVGYDDDPANPLNPIEEAVYAGPFRHLEARLGKGEDILKLIGVEFSGDGFIDLGNGNDELLIEETRFEGALTIRGQKGDDTAKLLLTDIDGLLSINGGSGDDSLSLFDMNVGSIEVKLGKGDDNFGFSGGVIAGETDIDGGAGDDQIVLAELNLNGAVEVDGGKGDDRLFVAQSSAGSTFAFDGGKGSDEFDFIDTAFAVPPDVTRVP